MACTSGVPGCEDVVTAETLGELTGYQRGEGDERMHVVLGDVCITSSATGRP